MGLTLSINKIFKNSPEESKGSCSIVLFFVEAMLFALIMTIFGKGNNDEKIAASIIIVVYILLLSYIHINKSSDCMDFLYKLFSIFSFKNPFRKVDETNDGQKSYIDGDYDHRIPAGENNHELTV